MADMIGLSNHDMLSSKSEGEMICAEFRPILCIMKSTNKQMLTETSA